MLSEDQGTALSCSVTARNTAGSTSLSTSTRVVPTSVAGAPSPATAPVITGTAATGQTLTCDVGTWTGDPTITFTTVWQRDGETIGTCAFKSAPDVAGAVEIAYMTFPAFERRGHATAMAAALVEIARAAGVPLALAHTLPEENASNRALRRNGFVFAGAVNDPEDGLIWRWELPLGG